VSDEATPNPNPPVRDRRKFLGGSDAAAVMGLSPWKTPVELWAFKTGRESEGQPDPVTEQRRMRILERGKKLEPFIRDMVIQRLEDEGLRVEVLAINEVYHDAEYPFLACEIDFELRLWGSVLIGDNEVHFDGEHITADAKSVGTFARKKWGEESTEDVPIEYATQFMHGLGITGRRYCLVAALRSFDDVDIFWTVRDDATIAGMRAKMAKFWIEHVLADVPPDPMEFSDIKFLFPNDNGGQIMATPEILLKVIEWRKWSDLRKQSEGEEEKLQFEIADFIRPHSELVYPGVDGKLKVIASWKLQSTGARVDAKRLKAEKPDVFELYVNTGSTRVLRALKALDSIQPPETQGD
jgi:putative phage-type endonuclease